MESLPPQAVSGPLFTGHARIGVSRCGVVAVLLFLPVVLAGCVSTSSFVHVGDDKPTGNACHVVATWSPEVAFAPDPAHGGTPGPGLVGRMYLFGPEIDYPLVGDGSLVVDLFTDTPGTPANKDVPLEEWRIDKDTLKRLQRRDAIGWGYTLFLPWGTYRPEVTQVRLRLRYEPANGSPLYVESSPLALNKNLAATTQVASRVVQPQPNPTPETGRIAGPTPAAQSAPSQGAVSNLLQPTQQIVPASGRVLVLPLNTR